MANNTFDNSMETIANVSKIVANVTNQRNNNPKPEKKDYRSNSTNQPHTQTVEVKVGDQNPNQPTVIEKKAETHIHKHFPDNRPLTDEECKVENHRIELEDEDKKAEREFKLKVLMMEMEERKEQAEYERREAERQREEARKARKRAIITAGILGGIGVGLLGYDIYTSARNAKRSGLALQPPKAELNVSINGEGTVE